jgi:hypothetical protein
MLSGSLMFAVWIAAIKGTGGEKTSARIGMAEDSS